MIFDKYFQQAKKEYNRKRGVEPQETLDLEWWHWAYDVVITILFLVILAVLFVYAYSRPPRAFPVGEVITIEEGQSLGEIARVLENEHVIDNPLLFKVVMWVRDDARNLVAGDYYFEQRADLFAVGERVARGEFGLTPLSVTIPEGLSVPEVAQVIDRQMVAHTFDKERFIKVAAPFEGYLFPDTYFFLPNTTEEEIVKRMRENFVERVSTIGAEIAAFGRPLEEVIVMASLVEREAYVFEDRQGIAGVLWNRLAIEMPLQVDAVFPYILGKNTFELTLEDLGYDSPQNTYRYPGLPPMPIVSPGLEAIEAAVTPEESDYLFYLADMEGTTHFCEDFECHKQKKRQYLN